MIRGGAKSGGLSRLQQLGFKLPWQAITILLRFVYGFHIEGAEWLPSRGPFILVHNELSPIGFLMTGWIDILALGGAPNRVRETITFLREERMTLPFFRKVINEKTPGKYAALAPSGSGRLALGLLEAYHVLQNDGVVVLYPEGDMTWDGRPLPLGHALAWLALHSAAPIVPALATIGAYDIWPRWQSRMNLKGRMSLRIDKPFRLSERPCERVTPEDIAAAERQMRDRFEQLCYGLGGLGEWAGVPRINRMPVKGSVHLKLKQNARPTLRSGIRQGKPSTRGIGFLLWRCPVCHTEDAIFHSRSLSGQQVLFCQACGSRWNVRRVPGQDLRLQITEGPAELVGLEMALSAWYDEIRGEVFPTPIGEPGVRLNAAEQVLLIGKSVPLATRCLGASAQGSNLSDSKSPAFARTGEAELHDWELVGKGRLLLTTERLIWQGSQHQLDIWWRGVSLITLWLWGTLTAIFGKTAYRFELEQENGLKWLAYSRIQAEHAAHGMGRKVTVSPF